MELEDRVTIATPEGLELEVQLAGLGSRFISGLTDLIIQVVLVVILLVLTGVVSGGGRLDELAAVIGAFLLLLIYPIAFEVLARGRTPGKRLTHLRVVRDGGSAVDLQASAIRNFMRLIDGPTLLYLPTVIGIIATRRNQRPGDLAGGTLVVREEPLAADAGTQAPSAPLLASWESWDVSAVTDADIAAVRQFLARRDSLTQSARSELARRLAEGLAAKVAGAPQGGSGERFLETLVAAKSRRQQAADAVDMLRRPGA
ncbi:MAG TPA: RDD family protein [Solirubrobacteraceae bacterium]|jgi:uncharacterized RDD family membrane protein YckC|nr:RDD family protein [Solirubrobacteraceae bacterium]